MKIIKNPNTEYYDLISKKVKDNDNYCPCSLVKNEDTICMCKEFRELEGPGACHCGRYVKTEKPMIVCICGSTRFKEQMEEARKKFTLQGYIVLGPELYGHRGDTITDEQKEKLDALHLEKIIMSDIVYVINTNNHIGESTQKEIDFAETLRKQIIYSEGF